MAEMSKSPGEIKKGLECCGKKSVSCDGCPYEIEFSAECLDDMHEDALAYIRQLEQIALHWQSSMDQVRKYLQDNGFQTFDELLQAYSQVKREWEAGHEWISVEDRLPKDQEIVLLGYAGNLTDCGYYDEEEAEWCNYESIKVESPTHWMPKPEPPKEE